MRVALSTFVALVSFQSIAFGQEVGFVSDGARGRTARALEEAIEARGLLASGTTWIGRMDSVGGGDRDVIVWTPRDLDRDRTVELVIYFEGWWSFRDDAMDTRHAAAIERLADDGRNAVYVAPDVPTSTHGSQPRGSGRIWDVCRRPPCRGVTAPGDFVAFYRDLLDRIDVPRDRVRLTLIGFSAGGRGVRDAIRQLALQPEDAEVRLDTVGLAHIVLADAIYGKRWLAEIWDHAGDLPGLERMTMLLMAGGRGDKNAAHAREFVEAHDDPRVHVAHIDGGHHDVGNRAVEHVVFE